MTVDDIYKHRFILSLLSNILILASVAIMVFIPDFQAITSNQDIKQKLINQLALIKQSNNPNEIISEASQLKPNNAIRFILKFIDRHELQLQFINQLDHVLQLQVKGSFIQVSTFILNLYRVNAEIDLYQLVDNTSGDVVTAKVNLNVVAASDESLNMINRYQLKNPFCLKSAQILNLNVHAIPINQFKWAGYLKFSRQEKALLLLPNNSIISVSLNDKIGREQALVYLITPSYVELLLPNKTFIKISSLTK